MKNIKLCTSSSDGKVSFLIGINRYYYTGFDQMDVDSISRLASEHKHGKAHDIAKKRSTEWKKDGGDWQPS